MDHRASPENPIGSTLQPPDDFRSSEILDVTFEGFRQDAFEVLERLRREPHIERYREEKASIKKYLTEPFKRFRDDLVVNWVIPNQLPFETERNVFSRLLKNDFGAGGCHHHLWMSFYRYGRNRLTDYQLIHSISPDHFVTGLHVGRNAPDLLKTGRYRILSEPARFIEIVNAALLNGLYLEIEVSRKEKRKLIKEPLDSLPDGIQKASSLWLRRKRTRDEVLQMGSELVRNEIFTLKDLWPLYVFLVSGE